MSLPTPTLTPLCDACGLHEPMLDWYDYDGFYWTLCDECFTRDALAGGECDSSCDGDYACAHNSY